MIESRRQCGLVDEPEAGLGGDVEIAQFDLSPEPCALDAKALHRDLSAAVPAEKDFAVVAAAQASYPLIGAECFHVAARLIKGLQSINTRATVIARRSPESP